MALEQPVFYYDLGEPECYLVAEHVSSSLPMVPEWEPVLARSLPVPITTPDRDAFARRVRELGLQPLRWPARWPPDSEVTMLAATYAKHVGRVVSFSLAAFRQAFAGGRDLGEEGTMLIAGAASEMHPTALLKAITLRSVTGGLAGAGERARAAGVTSLPAIAIGGRVYSGPECVSQAQAALKAVGTG